MRSLSMTGGKTILSASTLEKDIRTTVKHGATSKRPRRSGKPRPEGVGKKITAVVFDRAGYRYTAASRRLPMRLGSRV